MFKPAMSTNCQFLVLLCLMLGASQPQTLLIRFPFEHINTTNNVNMKLFSLLEQWVWSWNQ